MALSPIHKQQLEQTIDDQRYTINLEYCGYAKAQYVVRFCGRFRGACVEFNDALMLCIFIQGERMGIL